MVKEVFVAEVRAICHSVRNGSIEKNNSLATQQHDIYVNKQYDKLKSYKLCNIKREKCDMFAQRSIGWRDP